MMYSSVHYHLGLGVAVVHIHKFFWDVIKHVQV